MIRTVNIRALKDQLSARIRDVRRGDVFLVTDRGVVVAELRPPTLREHALDSVEARLERLAEQGALRLGLPNSPEAYPASNVCMASETIELALHSARGEKW